MTKLHHRFNLEAQREKKGQFPVLVVRRPPASGNFVSRSNPYSAVQHCISTLAAALKLRLKKVFTQSRVDGQPRIVLRHFGNLAKFTQSRC